MRKLTSLVDTSSSPPTVSAALRERLTPLQQRGILRNHALLQLIAPAGRSSSAALVAAADAALAEAPHEAAAAMFAAVATSRASSADAGVALIKEWLQGHSDADPLQPTLLAAHLLAVAKPPQAQNARQLLSHAALPAPTRFAPAMVATRAALAEKDGAAEVAQELELALAWWTEQEQSQDKARVCCACWEHLAALRLREGDAAAAAVATRQLQVRVCCACVPLT